MKEYLDMSLILQQPIHHYLVNRMTPTNVNENNEMYGTSLMLFSGQGFVTKHSTVRATLGDYST